MIALGQVSVMILREQRNAGTEKSTVIKWSPSYSSWDIHKDVSFSVTIIKAPQPSAGWKCKADFPDFSQLNLGLCQPLPEF